MREINREHTHAVKLEMATQKFGTDDLLPLWVADMDLASPLCVQEALIKRATHPIYGYTIYPDSYYEAIIAWMRDRFDWEVDREWITPCYGVVPSINFCVEALTQVGDGVIVQTPIYPPFLNSVHQHRRVLLENRLLYEDGNYRIDFEDFEAKAKEAKLFLLCSPHNPVGRVWDSDELERLVRICQENGVIIISDEIHSDIVYEKEHIVTAKLSPNETILFNAPSKTFNIAGLNTSFAIIPNKKIRSRYNKRQRLSGFGDGNPFGIEALIAAYSDGEAWLVELKKHLQKNIHYVNNFIREHRLDIVPTKTEATFLIWLDCQALGYSDEELERFFIQDAKLGLNSGRSFGEAGSGFMRLNIATSITKVKEAMNRILQACEKRD